MIKSEQKEKEENLPENGERTSKEDIKETPEEKLLVVQDKLLRTMAEMENQRRRFEKEKKRSF